MGLYPTDLKEVVLGPGVNNITASGYQTVEAELIAHPSNSGILYVRSSSTTGNGFPLSPGERLRLTLADLHDYTVSGVNNHRLAYAARR